MSQRLPDWKARLTAYLAASACQPYAPGVHDCALFAAGAVDAITGSDPSARWRGRYSTIAGGIKLVRRDGYADHVAAISEGREEIHPAYAAPGDIVAVDDPQSGELALGIVQGEMIYVLREDGLGLVPMAAACKVWQL